MKLRIGDVERTGPAADARNLAITPARLRAEIRTPDSAVVTCPIPGPAFTHVGHISPRTTLSPRTAIAAAARSRGHTTLFDAELRALHTERAELCVHTTDVPRALDAVADAGETVDSLRDQVARLGGVVAATDGDAGAASDARAALRTAAAELAEAETDLHTARQELARERDRQREANDARERRLELQDRIANRERDARRTLAERDAPRLQRALDALPAWPRAGDDAHTALAIARITANRAPIVVESGPFRTPGQARACLDGPVVLV